MQTNEHDFKQKGLVDQLSQTLFQKNRAQFIKFFKEATGDSLAKNAVGFFKGASEVPIYSSDVSYPEYQEAYFYYLFGVTEMDCYGVIDFHNEKSVLFVPKLDNYYKIWMTLMTLDDMKKKYPLIDEIYYTDDLEAYFKKQVPEMVYVNKGVNSDSGLTTMIAEDKFYKDVCQKTDENFMHNIIAESRVYKNDEEMEIMRWASKITCEAHCNVMRNVKPG